MQELIAIAIVAACLGWIGFRAWRTMSGTGKKGACGCDECPVTKGASTRRTATK